MITTIRVHPDHQHPDMAHVWDITQRHGHTVRRLTVIAKTGREALAAFMRAYNQQGKQAIHKVAA